MRRIGWILFGATVTLAAVFLLTGCDEEGFLVTNRIEATETEHLDLETVPPVVLDVESSNGRITIRGVANVQTASVTVTKRSRGETLEQAQDRVDRVTYQVTQQGNRTELRYRSTEQDDDVRRYSGVDFELVVPMETQVEVRTSNGAIEVVRVQGETRLDTSNGSIDMRECIGTVDAETSNGRIDIADHVGNVTADTSNGEIWMEDVAGRIDAETSNGSIHFTGRPADGVQNRLDTSNGSITVRVPLDGAIAFEVDVSNGTIRSDLPLVGDTQGNEWNAELNPPTTSRMDLRTSNGNIRIDGLP